MKNLKAILIIVATLVLGYVLGFLSNGRLHHHRMRAFLEYRTEEGFRRVAMEILTPDKDQMKNVGPIIDEYAHLNSQLNNSYRRDLDALQISYFNELEPYLTQQQINRLVGAATEPQSRHPIEPGIKKQTPDTVPPRNTSPSVPPKAKPQPLDTSGPSSLIPVELDSAEQVLHRPPPPMGGQGHMGPPATPEEKAERFSMMMRRQLYLDETQYQAVRVINLDHSLKMKEIHEKYKGVDYRTMMDEIAGLEETRNASFKEVLSPTQYDQYITMMSSVKKAWVHGRRRR